MVIIAFIFIFYNSCSTVEEMSPDQTDLSDTPYKIIYNSRFFEKYNRHTMQFIRILAKLSKEEKEIEFIDCSKTNAWCNMFEAIGQDQIMFVNLLNDSYILEHVRHTPDFCEKFNRHIDIPSFDGDVCSFVRFRR